MRTTNETKMTTRFQEDAYYTSNLEGIKGMYLAETIFRYWNEDFADEATGEVVSIKRKEIIFEKGDFLTADKISSINFFFQSGDLEQIKVSSVCRSGSEMKATVSVWQAVVKVGFKKRTYLLYANSLKLAYEIVTDFLEQEINGSFFISTLKEMDFSNLLPIEENEEEDLEFYQIELKIDYEDETSFESTYILKSIDAESAKKAIERFIADTSQDERERTLTIISAKKITCYGVVDYNFSKEYLNYKE